MFLLPAADLQRGLERVAFVGAVQGAGHRPSIIEDAVIRILASQALFDEIERRCASRELDEQWGSGESALPNSD